MRQRTKASTLGASPCSPARLERSTLPGARRHRCIASLLHQSQKLGGVAGVPESGNGRAPEIHHLPVRPRQRRHRQSGDRGIATRGRKPRHRYYPQEVLKRPGLPPVGASTRAPTEALPGCDRGISIGSEVIGQIFEEGFLARLDHGTQGFQSLVVGVHLQSEGNVGLRLAIVLA